MAHLTLSLVAMYACHLSNFVRAPDEAPLSRLNARQSLRCHVYDSSTKLSSVQFNPDSDETSITVELEGHGERAKQSMAESEKMHGDLLGPEVLEKSLKMDNLHITMLIIIVLTLRESERVTNLVYLHLYI
jgi:hypothetical protein